MGNARLPVPGKDDGRWGDILNEFLLVAHTEDGALRADAPTDGAVDEEYVTNAIQGKVNRSELKAVATSGSYTDLTNKPDLVLNNDARLANTRTPSDNSVTTGKLADGSITEPKLAANNTPNNGDVLTWSGAAFSWQVQGSAPVQSVNGRTGAVVVTKSDLTLDNVNNTSDANKPISTATQTALNLKIDSVDLADVATSGSYNDLTDKPDLVVNSDTRLTNTRTPTDGSVTEPKLAASNNPSSGDFLAWTGSQLEWQAQTASPVQSVNGHTGAAVVTKGDVGLGNADNTSDANKPISSATQTALDLKASIASLAPVATAGTYASLTGTPTLPTAGTGSSNYAVGNDTRITGALQTSTVTAKGDLLAATGNNAINRVAIGSDGQVLAADSSQAAGVRWTTPTSAPVSSVAGRTGAVTLTATDVGLANVNNTSDANKPISSATQTALDAKAATSSLSTVATSGSYTDLSSKPTIPTAGAGLTNTAGSLSVNYGTSGTTAAAGNDSRITGALQATIATTKGDVLAATGSGSFNRLGVGSDGQVLTADSSQATGVKWGTVAGGTGIKREIYGAVTGNTTAAAAANTDYVYIVASAVTITMPEVMFNNNQYTIKNNGSPASVTVAFTNNETADGLTGLTLKPFESVTLVSNLQVDGAEAWMIL